VTGPYGRQIAFTYSGTRLTQITDPADRQTSFSYDSAGNLSRITDPLGHTTSLSYNSRHQITQRTDRDGNAYSYSYDASGNLTQIRDAQGESLFSLSNDANWAIDLNALNLFRQRMYVPSVTRLTDGNGNQWQYHYNANGDIEKVVAPDGSTTTYAYDPTNYRLVSATDANGHTSSKTYYPNANLKTDTDALGHVTAYEYADSNCPDLVTKVTYPNGSVTEYQYDAACNRTGEARDVAGLNLVRQWAFNADGTLATESDPNGNVTSHDYDAFRNLIKTTDPQGNVTRYGYGKIGVPDYAALGNRTCTVDGNGHATAAAYDELSRIKAQVAKIGTVIDPTAPILPACDPTPDGDDIVTVEDYYDGNGNRTLVRHQSNETKPEQWQVTKYVYDQRNRMVQEIRDPAGEPLNPNPSPLNLVTSYTYDGNDNRIQETDANGHNTCSQYDPLNRLTVQIRKMGASPCSLTAWNDLVTQHFYDSGATMACSPDPGSPPCAGPMPGSSNIAYTIDPEQRHTHYKYDKVDRRWATIRKVNPYVDTNGVCDGNDWCEYTKYDPADNVLARIDANGNRTAMVYFANNWLLSETQDPGGLNLVTSYTYDGAGNVETVTNPRGNVVANTYDERNQLVHVQDSIGLVATYAYDGLGNRAQDCDGNGNCTEHSYDSVNRLVDTVDPMGSTALNGYDRNGNLIKVTDREGHVTCHYYDADNRRFRTAQLMGGTNCALLSTSDIWTDTEYDAVGNVTRLLTARLNSTPAACAGGSPPADCEVTGYQYDPADRLVQETYADATTRQFAYDKAGNLARRTDQLGQVTDYVYTDLYYLAKRDYQDPAEPDDLFTYDIGGRMTGATKDYPAADPRPDWAVTLDAYDAANRLLQTTQDATGIPMVIGYSYDTPAGLRDLVYPGGRACQEQMDLRDRLVDVTCDSFDAQYAYDLGNRVETRDYNNGVTATYAYNANNWITALDHAKGAAEIADFGHGYDKEGNKLYEQKSPAALAGKSEAYQYDAIYRLIDYKVGDLVGSTVPVPVTQRQYDLDKVGNWDQFTVDKDGAGPGVPVVYNNTPNQMNEYDDLSTDGPGEIPDDLGIPDNLGFLAQTVKNLQ